MGFNFWDPEFHPQPGELFRVTDEFCAGKCGGARDCRPLFLDRTIMWKKDDRTFLVPRGGAFQDSERHIWIKYIHNEPTQLLFLRSTLEMVHPERYQFHVVPQIQTFQGILHNGSGCSPSLKTSFPGALGLVREKNSKRWPPANGRRQLTTLRR